MENFLGGVYPRNSVFLSLSFAGIIKTHVLCHFLPVSLSIRFHICVKTAIVAYLSFFINFAFFSLYQKQVILRLSKRATETATERLVHIYITMLIKSHWIHVQMNEKYAVCSGGIGSNHGSESNKRLRIFSYTILFTGMPILGTILLSSEKNQ